MSASLVGSEMCIRDSASTIKRAIPRSSAINPDEPPPCRPVGAQPWAQFLVGLSWRALAATGA
eukprot:10623229-Alexandrium_andersonii.AAC.1